MHSISTTCLSVTQLTNATERAGVRCGTRYIVITFLMTTARLFPGLYHHNLKPNRLAQMRTGVVLTVMSTLTLRMNDIKDDDVS